MRTKEIISDLNKISSYYNFIYTLADINLRDFCGTSDELTRQNPREHLNYHEYAFLVGLWIKNSTPKTIRCDYDYELSRIYKLMKLLQKSFIDDTSLKPDDGQSVSEFMTDGTKFKEAFFYAGVGAYDDQYVRLAIKKYQLDDEWIKSNKGFSVKSFQSFFLNIKIKLSRKLNNVDHKMLLSTNRENNINLFTLSFKKITNNNEDFMAILNNFSIEIGKGHNKLLIDVGDYNEFKSKPIVKLDNERYFFPIPFAVAEAFYETPYYWMTSDKQYVDKSLKNRGFISEEIAYNILSDIFTKENTFKGVKINQRKATTITDIDVLIVHKNTALAFQVKSKKLTSISKNGNIETIKIDFKKAVEDAFLQGLLCENYLLNSTGYNFIDDDNENITNRITPINKVYTICLILDVFPAIIHSTQILLYENYSESTICLSILDLEIICKYLKRPEIVFDYFVKRINTCRYFYAEKELCYLGFYIDQGLKPIEGFTGTFIEKDYGESIDRLYYDEEYKYLQRDNQKYTKVGRNDLCPCGSGEKYKNCHLLR